MDKIDEQLNNLSKVEVPSGVHHHIMENINFRKIVPAFLVILIILLFNFIVVSWRINAKLIDAEFIDMTKDFFEVFSFDFSFFTMTFSNFFEIVSPFVFISGILSFLGIIYIVKKFANYGIFRK